jgi:hypothetical protein
MVENREMDISPGLIAGRLEGISIPDLIWSLCRLQVTGTLKLTRSSVRKTVYIQNGRIVFAASSDPDDRLGELLFREGLVSLDQLNEAVRSVGTGKRIGTILVEAGHLSPENLVRGVLLQVKSIVLDLFSWEYGEYRFEEGPLPTNEVITLGMMTGELLMQGTRGIRSFTRIRRTVGPPRTCYALTDTWEELLEGLNLTEGEEMILSRMKTGAATVEELCRDLFLSNFEIYQIYQGLLAFKILGAAQEDESIQRVATEATLDGIFGAEGIAPMMVRLGRTGQTGVLYVNRGALERTFHLKEGRCVFATSSNIDDGLVSYLLQRGVISLKDREETAKRLLSNKRVGTILKEIGVLDEDDLRNMVREHLLEIIYDTLSWEQGEYVFVEGELPTIEQITLESTMEDLVAEGLLRVTSWSRIREGCGGQDCRLTLSPVFLEVLDRMSIGPEEWEVVTSLKEPRSVTEMCRSSNLEDFRVCQLLWIFRLLGAIEPAPEVVEEEVVFEAIDVVEEPEPEIVVEPEPPVEEVVFEAIDVVEEPEPEPVEDEEEQIIFVAEEPEPEIPVEPEPEELPPVMILGPEMEVAEEEPEPEPDEPLLELDAEPEIEEIPVEMVDEPAAEEIEEPEPEMEEPVWELGSEDDTLEIPVEVVDEPVAEVTEEPVVEVVEEEPEPEEIEEPEPEREEPVWELGEPEVLEIPVEMVDEPADEEPEEPEPMTDATVRLSREEVEAAISAEEGPEEEIEEPEEEIPVLDSPADATLYIAREELEGVLEPPAEEESPDLEIADPSPAEVTEEIDREEIEASVTTEEESLIFEPPADLDEQISRINMRQRVVFRTIRAEVGAGAVNFVRSCCGRTDSGEENPFRTVEIQPDGSWDSEGLRKAVVDLRIADPEGEYRRLVDTELEMLHMHIGEARAQALREQVESVDPLERR